MRTAFSRDQQRKVYVQDLIREDGDNIWQLLNARSAHVYVCGDAKLMAADVHRALVDIVRLKGQMTEDEAVEYAAKLESVGRYQKDVWIT